MTEARRTTKLDARNSIVYYSHSEFILNYEQTKRLAIGQALHGDDVSAGGHLWRINCYPRGVRESDNGEYLSIFVELRSRSRSEEAVFEARLLDSDGQSSPMATKITHAHAFESGSELGWSRFIARTDMVKNHVNTEGQARFVCAIKVIQDESIHVPPSDIGEHLGMLLDSTYGADVSFTVEGETFYAHRAVLAARSPVFKAELFGFMSEATMPSITLHEMASTTFRVILRYIYTDTLPGNDELGDDPTEMFKHLIAAADRYALDRLKLMCAQKTVGQRVYRYGCPCLGIG